jgi:pimeloyl-ACP methyl ester carboxylesterase
MAPGAQASAGVEAGAELIVVDGGNRLLPRLIRYLRERREHEARWTGAIESHPAPLTIVWGDRDPIAVYPMTDRLVERRPDAARTRLTDVGHFPMLEAPDAFASAVLAGL